MAFIRRIVIILPIFTIVPLCVGHRVRAIRKPSTNVPFLTADTLSVQRGEDPANEHAAAMIQPNATPTASTACFSSNFQPASKPRLEGLIPEMRMPYPTTWLHNQPTNLSEFNEHVMSFYGAQVNNTWQLCQQQLLLFGGHNLEATTKRVISNVLGHARVKVYDMRTGTEIFQIRRTHAKINPASMVGRETYRITKPGNDEGSWAPFGKSEQVLYTLNREHTLAWKQAEWRVYKGHKRDAQLLYYCQGDPPWSRKSDKGNTTCWHSKAEYDAYQPPAMAMERMKNMGALFGTSKHASTFNTTFEGRLGIDLAKAASGGTVVKTVDRGSVAANVGIPSGAFIVGVGDKGTDGLSTREVIALVQAALAAGPATITFGLPALLPPPPDSLILNIGPNEDTALLLALNAISAL